MLKIRRNNNSTVASSNDIGNMNDFEGMDHNVFATNIEVDGEQNANVEGKNEVFPVDGEPNIIINPAQMVFYTIKSRHESFR